MKKIEEKQSKMGEQLIWILDSQHSEVWHVFAASRFKHTHMLSVCVFGHLIPIFLVFAFVSFLPSPLVKQDLEEEEEEEEEEE